MATVSESLEHVKAHLTELFPDQEIFRLCGRCGHVWRECVLNPAVIVRVFLLQLLAHVAMRGLRRVAKLPVTAQAICQAKQRLPLKILMELLDHSVPKSATSDWKGLSVYMADATHFKTPDTPELARRYGKGKNQRGTSRGYPQPKLLALMDFTGGFIRKFIALPASRQEYTCLSRLFRAIGSKGLLLGDRGLVSFTHLAMLINAGIQGCFRLPRRQVVFNRGKASRRLIKRQGKQDLLVRWTACRCPSWLSAWRWKALLGRELVLRQISFRVCRKGFRTHQAWIVTTLLDPEKYPAQELVELYSKRWQIEVYFRDLKQTLKMSMVSAKTVVGVQKEMCAFVLLYNVIRGLMQQAAVQQGTTADRISFTDALQWLLWSGPGEPLPKLEVNPIRVRRSPARKLKEARHRYTQLKESRALSSKPPCQVML